MPIAPLLHTTRRVLPVRRLQNLRGIRSYTDSVAEDTPAVRRIKSWNPSPTPHVVKKVRRVNTTPKDPDPEEAAAKDATASTVTAAPEEPPMRRIPIRRVAVQTPRPLIRIVDTGRDVPKGEVEAIEASGAPRIGRKRVGPYPFAESVSQDPSEPKILTDMPKIRFQIVDVKNEVWVYRHGKVRRPYTSGPAIYDKRWDSSQHRLFSSCALRQKEDGSGEGKVWETRSADSPTPQPSETDMELARSLLRLSNTGESTADSTSEQPSPQIRRVSASQKKPEEGLRIRKYISGRPDDAKPQMPSITTDKPMSTDADTLSKTLNPLTFVRDVLSSFSKHSGLEPTLLPGLKILSVTPGTVQFYLPIEQCHTNRMKNLHGGTMAAMVDLGGSLAVASRGLFATGVSTDLSVTYIGSGGQEGDVIYAEAKCDRLGGSLAFTRIEFYDKNGELVARGSHTKYISLFFSFDYSVGTLLARPPVLTVVL